ncbi:hypothetical protein L445_05553 [Klebsiella pneumoniae BIDMC 16]|nr:hypothetical protein L445_05553 [Klebsiella pneumoniae BIDMC 16]
MRSFFSARNLLPCKRKNHLGRWFDRRLSQLGNCLTVVTGFRRAQQPNLSFQCSRTLAHTSRATACLAKQNPLRTPSYQWLLPVAFCVLFRLDSSEQLPDKAQQSGLNGGSCLQPSLERTTYTEPRYQSVSYEKAPHFPQGRKAEQVSGKRQGWNRRAQEGAIHRKR